MPDGSNVDLCRKEIIEDGLRIIVPNTPGAELVADLKPDPHVELDADLLLNGDIQTWGKKEFVIYKPRWGAFYKTPLDSHLRDLGVSTLVICGCNFPNCPRATIYEASERDYKVVLVEDAVSGIYEKAKEELRHIGVRVWPTRKLIDEIGNQ
jgi:nicotinamidase-related amidase